MAASKKGKKRLSKKERIALKIKKIQERGQKEIDRQIAKAQGIKDKHGDKTAKLREKMKAQKAAHKAKVQATKDQLVKKYEGKLENAAKKAADKQAKAVTKATKQAKKDAAKTLKKLGKVISSLQALSALKGAPVLGAKLPRSKHPMEPAASTPPTTQA